MERASDPIERPTEAEPELGARGDDLRSFDAGRLVFVPPQGEPREVSVASLRAVMGDGKPVEGVEGPIEVSTGQCPECACEHSVETLVREHEACGYVGMDGFVPADGHGQFVCPKCETVSTEAFPVVATVHSCLHCGHTMDRPIGGAPR